MAKRSLCAAISLLQDSGARRFAKLRRFGRYLAAAFLTLAGFAATPAMAQNFTVSTIDAPELAQVVVAATGATTWRIAPAGGVTKQSGNGTRPASSGNSTSLVTITCTAGGSACNAGKIARVRIGTTGSNTGKISGISGFTILKVSGISNNPTISGTNPIQFDLTMQTKQTPMTFRVGMDVATTGADGAGAYGNATGPFQVLVATSPTTPTTGLGSSVTALVSRPMQISGPATINFGTISRPPSGTETYTLDPNSTNAATFSGGVLNALINAPTRMTYTATGEGGQTISWTLPGSATLNRVGGGGSISVTLPTSTPQTTLSNAAGTAGTAVVYMGATFTVGSGTVLGNYSGSWNVTVAYN
jgi:hypothetical protein